MAFTSPALAAHIQGLREASRAFKALPEIVRDRMLEATEITVREIARQARAKIIASPSVQTGILRDHIGWSVSKKTGRGKVGILKASIIVRSKIVRPTRYAHLVEFGSVKMPAEPFMIPAAEAEKQPYLQRCIRAGKDIEKDAAAIGMRTL